MNAAPLTCVEGEAFVVDAPTRHRLNLSITRLQRELRFRSWPLADSPGGKIVINGIVGTIAIGDGRNLEVTPKTNPGDTWIASVLSLLVGADRIDAAGERKAGLVSERKSLRAVMAAIYASRLEEALRREGPLLLLVRQRRLSSSLRGKLNASLWLRHSLRRPHLFPTESSALTANNDFSQGLAFVAELLARETPNHGVKSRLFALQKALLPGRSCLTHAPNGVELRSLPIQWAAYDPAWSIARTILLKKSLLGPAGGHQGISIAIEMWPLLERLLCRSLRAATRVAQRAPSIHVGLSVPPRPYSKVLLSAMSGSFEDSRSVEPDGILAMGGNVRATFDAKYKKRNIGSWPSREDIYQVVTTAAAYNSPLAVLVYPDKFDAVWWSVNGMKGAPAKLAALGLGLFSFRPGSGDSERGREILRMLDASEESSPLAGNISI